MGLFPGARRGPLLFPSPSLVDRENAGVTSHFRPLLGPREGRGEVATSDFVPLCWGTLLLLLPFVGDPRECHFAVYVVIRVIFFFSL